MQRVDRRLDRLAAQGELSGLVEFERDGGLAARVVVLAVGVAGELAAACAGAADDAGTGDCRPRDSEVAEVAVAQAQPVVVEVVWQAGPDRLRRGFAPDAIHIATGGRLDRGRAEITDGHTAVLSAWGRGSSKTGRIDRLQFLTADIALLTAYGDITFEAEPAGEQIRRTIETLTAQKVDWSSALVTCQYTPLGHWPQSTAASSGTPPSPADDGTLAEAAPTAPPMATRLRSGRCTAGCSTAGWMHPPTPSASLTTRTTSPEEANSNAAGGRTSRATRSSSRPGRATAAWPAVSTTSAS